MKARSYKTEAALSLVTLGIISLMLLLNDVNQYVRIREIRSYIQKSNREENNISHMGLVMKYQAQKRVYENQIRQDDADLIEMRANSILAEASPAGRVTMSPYLILSGPSVFMINMFRAITQKGPIRFLADDPVNVYLGVAYYYERNNAFAGALRIYERALKEEKYDTSAIAGILLHQGYCHAITGSYQVARDKYLSVIREYENAPAAATALILLRFLDGFRAEVDRIIQKDKDSLEKADKLFTLLAYREALDVIGRIEKKTSPAEAQRLMYIRGRSLEGLSEKEKAIDTYQEAISRNPASPYAALANRRIYLAGAAATNGAKVMQLAEYNNRLIGDPVFKKMTEQERKLRGDGGEEENPVFRRELAREEKLHPVLDIGKVQALSRPGRLVKTKKTGAEMEPEGEQAPAVIFRVETVEGNVFIGAVQSDTGEKIILKTTLGTVTIPKEKIVSKKKM
ncbi:MAG: tetratricopeptide repeat protein [Spirochaetes bacterium]|nr:tetratricopeptide repeat protein [Spirochaetota bacterium]